VNAKLLSVCFLSLIPTKAVFLSVYQSLNSIKNFSEEKYSLYLQRKSIKKYLGLTSYSNGFLWKSVQVEYLELLVHQVLVVA